MNVAHPVIQSLVKFIPTSLVPGATALDDLTLLRLMAVARESDRREGILFRQGRGRFQLPGAGHEALAAFARALAPEDMIFPHYRDRALLLARGVPNIAMARTYFGKATATGGGRQLPSHYDHRDCNVMSCASPTGLQCLPAAGAAWAQTRAGTRALTLCCLGDATTREGEFYEALAFALQESLPLVFLVEDNGYGISTPTARRNPFALGALGSDRVVSVDGRDVAAVEAVAREAAERARSGGGPSVVVADLDRLYSHTSSDDHRRYRTPEDIAAMWARDPLVRFKDALVAAGAIDEVGFDELRAAVEAEVTADYAAAEAEAEPVPSDAPAHLYASAPLPAAKSGLPPGADTTMIGALGATLDALLAEDPRVLLFGEDIEDGKGGVFQMTKGLSTRYPGRVVNAPLAEATIAGVGAGLALAGMRPIVELQFVDFVGPAFNQLVNQIATLRWRSCGDWTCPLVMIAPCGAYLPSGGPWHSQSNESWFIHTPGLRVVVPSTPEDAAACLRAAMAGEDPVLVLVPKHLFRARMPTRADTPALRLGEGRVRRDGEDVTLVTWGNCTELCLEAAERVAADGIEARVVDLVGLAPWDEDLVRSSVARTGNLVVVHEDFAACGFGGTIVADICADRDIWAGLRAPPRVVASRDVPIGFNPALEAAVLPSVEDVITAIRETCDDDGRERRNPGAAARRGPAGGDRRLVAEA